MASILLEKVGKVYPNGYRAVEGLDLEIAEGEFLVLVGPSRCGKTTVLRMIAGLEDISTGNLKIGGTVVNDLEPKDRDVAMVFQNYALYPHMSVAENIGFALKLRKLPRDQIRKKVEEAADILGLTEWLDRKPKQLSGGQRQRVAMGRAIVRSPKAFLMDEPLSNLDAKLRVKMRSEVRRIQERLGVATVYVSHDQVEAMTMGDRVAVMKDGVLQQCDTPQRLYDHPVNQFVGAFIGSPAMNLYEAELGPESASLSLGSQTLAIPPSTLAERPALRGFAGRKVTIGIRPEDLVAARPGEPADSCLITKVQLLEALGSEMIVHFSIDANLVTEEAAAEVEEDILVQKGEGVARVAPDVSARAGGTLMLQVATERIHFFDPETTNAIWR